MNGCQVEDFNTLRERIIDKESKISKLIEYSSLERLNNHIKFMGRVMMNEFTTFLSREFQFLIQSMKQLSESIQDEKESYQAVKNKEFLKIRNNQNIISNLRNPPDEFNQKINQITKKISKRHQITLNFLKELKKNNLNNQQDPITIKRRNLLQLKEKEYEKEGKVILKFSEIEKLISKLEKMSKLTNLIIDGSNNKIVDISPILKLKTLTKLTQLEIYLGNNIILDITPIGELNTLTSLTKLTINLDNNKILNISPIGELKTLTQLTQLGIYLDKNQIVDIRPIRELKTLIKLTQLKIDFCYNPIKKTSIQTITSISQLEF